MTRVLHTIWIRIFESIMYANRIRKMINIELGNEIKNMFFRLSLPSLGLGSALFIAWGAEESLGRGGGSHGFKLEQRGISRRQKSKNCLMGIRKIVL